MKRILLQYDLAHNRLPRVERILDQLRFLKEYGLTGVILYLDGEGAWNSLPVRGSIPPEYLNALKEGVRGLSLEFVPHIQTLGHLERLLKHPQMTAWRDDPAGGRVIRIDLPEVREGMKRYLTEMAELFDSEYIHCGGDEAATLGLGDSQNYLKNKGLENSLAEYWNELCDTAAALGKKMVLYGDELIVYPSLRRKLDPRIVIANWGYCAEDEVFESENHHYSAHSAICAGRENWITGNTMGEYIFPAFQRLQENLRILQDAGRQSGADTFVISDWGSYENINPMLNTTIGGIYLLRRLADSDYLEVDFLREISGLVFGGEHHEFISAIRTLLHAQDRRYWPPKLSLWGPMFPRFLAGDPDGRATIACSAVLNPGQLAELESELHQSCSILNAIPRNGAMRPEWLDDLQGIAKRMRMTVLRAKLCQEHAWYAGAVWITAEERNRMKRNQEQYRVLAEQDLLWHESVWRRDCLAPGLRESCGYLRNALESAAKTFHCPENTLLHFIPE